MDPAQRFVVAAKDFLMGKPISEDFWRPFTIFANNYAANNTDSNGFQLLLSERSSGKPLFHTFDSKEGFKENVEPPITLGTGKDLLDDFVFGTWKAKAHELLLDQSSLSSLHFPYLYALLLMERSQGFEASQLQEQGVGGYFHFAYQTGNTDSRQAPAVYVLVDVDHTSKNLIGWVYRVSFCGPALVVECPVKNQRCVHLESSSWPKCKDLTKFEIEELFSKTILESEAQPYYNFCGFGVANPELRAGNCFEFTATDNYLIDRDGNSTPKYDSILKKLISDGMRLNKEKNNSSSE